MKTNKTIPDSLPTPTNAFNRAKLLALLSESLDQYRRMVAINLLLEKLPTRNPNVLRENKNGLLM